MAWKDEEVKIIQIYGVRYTHGHPVMIGLGDDSRLYRWSYSHGKWEEWWEDDDD